MGSGASSGSTSQNPVVSQQRLPTITRTVETTTIIDDADGDDREPRSRFPQAFGFGNSYGQYDVVDGADYNFLQGRSRTQDTSNYNNTIYNNEYGFDEDVELAVAPSDRSEQKKQQNARRGKAQLPFTESKNSEINEADGVLYRSAERNEYTRAADLNSVSEELVFEVYHCDNGRDYDILNDNGARFYLDSWTTDEWQPFPVEWLQYGWIEVPSRAGSTQVLPSAPSMDVDVVDSGVLANDSTGNDRMGSLDHPGKGKMTTYFFEEKLNVPAVFDPDSGAWMKLPLCWEMGHPPIRKLIDTIQQSVPHWRNKFEILAMLRQCNYETDEVIMTYLSLMDGDELSSTGVYDKAEGNEELKKANERIAYLEESLKIKNAELEQTQERNSQLRTQLNTTEETAKQLQIELTAMNSDFRVVKEKLQQQQEAKPPTPQTVHTATQVDTLSTPQTLHTSTPVETPPAPQIVHTPTPVEKPPTPQIVRVPTPVKRPIVSPSTVRAVKVLTASLSESLKQIQNALAGGMGGIQIVLKQAFGALAELKNKKHDNSKELEELRRLYHREVLQRKLLYNQLQELRGNIRVFCRCRHDSRVKVALEFPSDEEIRGKTTNGQSKSFQFDRVFTPSSTQEDVFQDTIQLITSCVDGYNVCIMAYGQTGSGKTFTMMGPDSNPGVNIRAIQELLRVCEERTTVDYTMRVSMVEVYNETLRDLLCASQERQLNIQMRGKQLIVTDLTEEDVRTTEDIKEIMAKGDANRSVGATKMNIHSSRSHLLLMLKLEGHDTVSRAVTRGTLTLVDLAGSERVSKTEATGQRLIEAAAINKSLTALGQVFMALRTNSMHVPYRNSKLTQLLQTSLGGDGKACLFANVSPAESNMSETLSTLQFGSAARQVQLGKASQNITKMAK